ncbi:ATP-binding protein [Bacillus sp. AFS096315]|uniref:ATP-binding protein n=1 Tax=Bacillus sp. AFS096315 TaxID=2033517 RepID=UPI000BEC8C6C|nr:ATP-binding protein [Bacillus sp. AFS096315]PEC48932.1 ATP-binding protein [Bacillus sp. AFS096315]
MNSLTGRQTSGIKKGLNIKGNSEEIAITEKFSKYFGVTFSRQGKFKTTDYTIAFLQPDKRFRESFNMFNEVLLFFSPYISFDRRAMDFIDKTLSDFDNRLDKVCIFIVSKDNKISKVIEQINSENKDSKIFVPFTYEEILSRNFHEKNLDNKLRKYFYNRDLFALESPLKTDAYFFGRNNIVQAFYDKYSSGEQGGLFGLRKIGKTSVLFALERLILLRGGNSIYIDCQSPAVHMCRWNELLRHIVTEIVKKYNLPEDVISSEDCYNERLSAKYFEEDMNKLNKALNNRRILLIFDEIEHISFETSTSSHWSKENNFINFWQTIRAIFQKDNSLFSFIITGVNPLCVETPSIQGYDNPIFGMINPLYLDLFNIKDVKDMISNIGKYMGLQFDEEIFTKLTDDYGGHPFLIRHVCSLINTGVHVERPYTVTKYDYAIKKEEYDKRLSGYIELILQILEKWYTNEYQLLEILAVEGNDKFKIEINKYSDEIQHLIGYGILKKNNDNYFITINAISEYIKNKFTSKGKPTAKEEVWKLVTVERNTLEIKLRQLVKINIASSFGKKNLKSKLLEVIDSKKRALIEEKDFNDILTNQFFLLDLKKVIVKNWDIFDKIFNDKTKFQMHLEIINELRVDAHAKTLSEEDYALLMYAFRWFKHRLDDIV